MVSKTMRKTTNNEWPTNNYLQMVVKTIQKPTTTNDRQNQANNM